MAVEFDLNKTFESAIKLYKEKKATIHQENGKYPYVTVKDDPNGKIEYCPFCFGYEGKLVPLSDGCCMICCKR